MSPRAAKIVLLLAAAYNLVWGTFVVVAPLAFFRWLDLEAPRYPEIWQCLGMVIGVYGVGYAIAAYDHVRHWPIVLVGLLGKVFGPIGVLWYASQGVFPWSFGLTCITNDLIWWIPFGLLLRDAWRSRS